MQATGDSLDVIPVGQSRAEGFPALVMGWACGTAPLLLHSFFLIYLAEWELILITPQPDATVLEAHGDRGVVH